MIKSCKSELQKMTQDLENGMTFAMSVWKSDDFDWLQHGRCSGTCTEQDLKFKNFVFTSASGNQDVIPDSGDEDTVTISDIAAGFEAIRNNPHYNES